MDQRESASTSRADGDGFGISENPRDHDESCYYYQYQDVHSKALRSKEQVEQRLRQDLLRKKGKAKTQAGVIAEVDARVAKAMSDTGVVSRYLKVKSATYVGSKDHLKSFCNCETAKIKVNGHQPGGKKMEAPNNHGYSKDTADVLKKDEELKHRETIPAPAALEPTSGPSSLEITHSDRQELTPNQILKSEELDLSEEDEELKLSIPKAPVFNIMASASENPHDELDYSDDEMD